MKLGKLLLGSLASLALLVGCDNKEEDLGAPSIKLNPESVTFASEGGEQTVALTSTRDWTVADLPEWLSVSPTSGKASNDAQTITLTALKNEGTDRNVSLEFKTGLVSATLKVSQSGPGGSVEASYVYSNNFDKEDAVKGESGWKTYLDSFEGWKNQTGSGIEAWDFAAESMSARTGKGNSSSQYSDYEGSGRNYLWFGSGTPYFILKNLKLDSSKKDYTLSFGAERNNYDDKENNVFKHEEFKVYVSNDGNKWVELAYTFAKGTDPNRRWDLASSTFTVPAGTEALYIYMTSTIGSTYAIDDLSLAVSPKAGTAVDFTSGVELPGGGGVTPEPGPVDGAIKDVIAAEVGAAVTVKGQVIAVSKQSFIINDGLDQNLLVFAGKAPEVVVGDVVKVSGKKATYGQGNPAISQVTEPVVEKISESIKAKEVAAKELTAAQIDAYSNASAEYIKVTGTIVKSEKFTNIDFGGSVQGSPVATDLSDQLVEGARLVITGYFAGVNKGGYFCILPVKVEGSSEPFFCVTETALNASAAAGSVKFTVSSNVEWTVSSDNASFTVNPDKGNGTAEITVSYPENTKTEAVVANIKVTTTNAQVATKEYTVKITQAGALAGNEKEVVWTIGQTELTWNADEDGTYGKGFSAQTADLKVGYYQYKSTSKALEPSGDHFRVYKSSELVITPVGGKLIKSVTLECTADDKCLDLTLADGSVAKADKEAKTISWTGSVAKFEAQAAAGQVRIKKVTVIYE